MQNEQDGEILVGIDGSTAATTALELAADEAERRGWRLVIAHAGDITHRGALTEDNARAAAHLPRLGPLASWLLHHSPCPVAIVGRTADTTAVRADVAVDPSPLSISPYPLSASQ